MLKKSLIPALMVLMLFSGLASAEAPKAVVQHLNLARQDEALLVNQVVEFNAGTQGPVEIAMPEGYFDLLLPEQLRDRVREEGSALIFEGFREDEAPRLVFSYYVPLEGPPMTFSKVESFDTHNLVVAIQATDGLVATGGGLDEGGAIEMEPGRVVYFFQRQNLSAGDVFEFTIQPGELAAESAQQPSVPAAREEPQAAQYLNKSFHGGSANVKIWMRVTGTPGHYGMAGVGVMALALAGLVAGGVSLVRRRRRVEEPQEEQPRKPQDSGLEEERRRLIGEIASLDRSRKAGEIEEEEYLRVRGELKNKLVDIVRQLER